MKLTAGLNHYGLCRLFVILLVSCMTATAGNALEKRASKTVSIHTLSGTDTKYVQPKSIKETKKRSLRMANSHPGETLRVNPLTKREPAKAEGGVDATWIYGSLDWSDNWDDDYTPFGIYRIPINGNDGVRFVKIDDMLRSNGGGVYKDGKYYFIIRY